MLLQNLIAGERVGEPLVDRRNPARPRESVAVTPRSTAQDARDAIAAAAQAQPTWAALTETARGAIILQAAEILHSRRTEIAQDLVREEGKTLPEATGEVRRAIDVFRYFGASGWRESGSVFPSATPDTMVFTTRQPLGVVGVITPWNFPIAIPAWKLAPALVTGNAVVFKPAELTPRSADHLTTALTEAGLPPGVLNVVYGAGSVVGEAIIAHREVAAISFTGSTLVGRHIQEVANARYARVQLEMGGKNAVVVLDDADIEQAAAITAIGGFGLTGQACTATSRVVCTPGAYGNFVTELSAQATRYRPGDGLEENVLMGPVVSHDQLDRDIAAIGQARADGATVRAGGGTPAGLFLDPTILLDVRPDQAAAREEIFGPVISVLSAADLDEAISIVNDSSYGLAAAICTRDLAAAHQFTRKAHAGVVKVNRPTTGLDLNAPFGGVKNSSTNTFREQGPTAVDFYTWSKTVYLGYA